MRGFAWLALIIGCADVSSQKTPPATFGDRDLGDHLAPPDNGDMAEAQSLKLDLSSQPAMDLSMGSPVVDMAKPQDLAAPPDMALPPINEPPVYVHTATTLYKLNPNTFDLTLVGNFNIAEDITDIAEKDDGSLLAISFTSVYKVNTTTGAASLYWDALFDDMNALTYMSDGRLLSADLLGNVFELDLGPNLAVVLLLGNYGSGQLTAGDLVSVDDGTMWGFSKAGGGATDTNNTLMIVNNVNGKGSVKGATGFGKIWGSAYSGHRLLAFTGNGEIVEINASNGTGTLRKSHAGLSFYGATSNPTVLR